MTNSHKLWLISFAMAPTIIFNLHMHHFKSIVGMRAMKSNLGYLAIAAPLLLRQPESAWISPKGELKQNLPESLFMDQFLKVIPHFVRKITYYHKLKGKTDIYVWGGAYLYGFNYHRSILPHGRSTLPRSWGKMDLGRKKSK